MTDPEIPTERVGLVVVALLSPRGKRWLTADLAVLAGIKTASMWVMLCKLSRVIALCKDRDGWYVEED